MDSATARQCLEASGWDVQRAVDRYLADAQPEPEPAPALTAEDQQEQEQEQEEEQEGVSGVRGGGAETDTL